MDLKSRDQQYMHGYLIGLPSAKKTPFPFMARRNEVFVEPQTDKDVANYSPIELALIKIQEDGSAPRNFESVSKAEIYSKPLFVAGYDSSNQCLVVGDSVSEDGTLWLPANLRLSDVIEYSTIQKLDKK